MPKSFRYEVHNPELKNRLRVLAESLRKAIPIGYGFALHIIKYGEDGDMFFASSVNRADYIKCLKEFIEHYEEKGESSNESKQTIV